MKGVPGLFVVCTTASITLIVVTLWHRTVASNLLTQHDPYSFAFYVVLLLNGIAIGWWRQGQWRMATASALICVVSSGILSWREFFG
jgi:hypothetical protein